MQEKLYSFGECMAGLIRNEENEQKVETAGNGTEYSEFSRYDMYSPTIAEPNFSPYPGGVTGVSLGYVEPEFDPIYRETGTKKQAMYDVEQLNETVFEDVQENYSGNLVLTKYSRNGRQRQFLIALDELNLKGKIWKTTGEALGAIAEIDFYSNGKPQKIFCYFDRIKGSRLSDALRLEGVTLNTDLKPAKTSELINNFVLKLLARESASWIPRYKGWNKSSRIMKFYREEESWGWMKRQVKF